MWCLYAVLSALFLGIYDVCKKRSLSGNSVVGVLACSVIISALLLAPSLLTGVVPHIDARTHGMIFIKSLLVLSSWLCGYIAIKYIPLSIVSPMQASRPMWTLLGALLIFNESLNLWQWLGIAVTLGSIFAFSFSVRHDKTEQSDNAPYYIFLILAILLGAACGLYDKYIMRSLDRNAVQVYYTLYQALLMALVWIINRFIVNAKNDRHPVSFHWRWEIVGISIFLILSDYVYLKALSDPSSLIAVVSTVRRAGTIIPFLYGIIILREKHIRAKVLCLLGVTLGLVCLLFGTL